MVCGKIIKDNHGVEYLKDYGIGNWIPLRNIALKQKEQDTVIYNYNYWCL